MDFTHLGCKSDLHRHLGFQSVPSYMQRMGFSTLHKESICREMATKNRFMQNVGIMNFIPQQFCQFYSDLEREHLRKLDYSPVANDYLADKMNVSYLIGGFVGSKSQIGFTSMQGDRFQIWDLVLQKLVKFMSNNKSADKDFKLAKPGSMNQRMEEQQILNDSKLPEQKKRSYAEVAKVSSGLRVMEERSGKINDVQCPPNMQRTLGRTRRRHNCHSFKGTADFVRNEKKNSLQDPNGWSSSRWSNSRRKYGKKGVQKTNRRDEREAARDGIEFANQECSTKYYSSRCPTSFSDYKEKRLDRNEPTSSGASNSETLGTGKVYFNNPMGEKQNSSSKIGRRQEQSATSPVTGSRRLSSESSVESEDSFIVFDYSACNPDMSSGLCNNTENFLKRDWTVNGICDIPYLTVPSAFTNVNSSVQLAHLRKYGNPFSVHSPLVNHRKSSSESIDSEDNFIVFDSGGDSVSCSSDYDSSTEEDSDNESNTNNLRCGSISQETCDSDSDEDYTLTDGCTTPSFFNRCLKDVNKEWGNYFRETNTNKKKNTSKTVCFLPEPKLTNVKTMVAWDYALRAARVGPWEELARDTMRFQNRIQCVGSVLQSILEKEHRTKIWRERFADDVQYAVLL